ncbi:MAG: hypothetical protein ACLFXM_06875 [Acidimicrobiia bacterium]
MDFRAVGLSLPGAALLGAALLFGGCGDDGGGDDGPTAGADEPDETAGACGLLTVDEVSELFGRHAAVTPVEGAPQPSTSCSWTAESDGEDPTSWQLQLQAYEGSEFFDADVWGDDPQPIDDLGDEAFVVDGGDLRGVTAAYREGDKSVIVGYTIVLGEDAPDPAAQQDEVVELLRKVHERF